MNSDYIKSKFKEINSIVKNRYNVKSLLLFGSYARGDANNNSDVDILVEFTKTPDLLTFIELEEFLSKKIEKKLI